MKMYALVPLGAIREMTNSIEHVRDMQNDAVARGETLILVKPMDTIVDADRRAAMERAVRGRTRTSSDPWSMIMAALDDLKSAVAKNTSVIESTLTLISDLASRTAASSDPAMVELSQQLNAESDKLAAAVLANTQAVKVEPSTTAAPADVPPPA